MIILTKLNGIFFTLNCDLIESIQENPDTTIHCTTGNLYIVKETMEQVVQKTVEYKRRIFQNAIRGNF
ncbi:flagellar FlbD family protein [Oscillospiraceae bacterium PP1C4]